MKFMFGDAGVEVLMGAVDWIGLDWIGLDWIGLQWVRTGANLAVLKAIMWPLVAIKCRRFQCRAVSQQFRQNRAACSCGQHLGQAAGGEKFSCSEQSTLCLVLGSAAGYRSTFTGSLTTQLTNRVLVLCISFHVFPLHSLLTSPLSASVSNCSPEGIFFV